MKKALFLMILSALLLGGCGREKLPEEKAAAPVQAQNVNYTEEEQTSAPTAEGRREAPLEGTPLEENLPNVEPGYIPSPEPIEPTVETAEN